MTPSACSIAFHCSEPSNHGEEQQASDHRERVQSSHTKSHIISASCCLFYFFPSLGCCLAPSCGTVQGDLLHLVQLCHQTLHALFELRQAGQRVRRLQLPRVVEPALQHWGAQRHKIRTKYELYLWNKSLVLCMLSNVVWDSYRPAPSLWSPSCARHRPGLRLCDPAGSSATADAARRYLQPLNSLCQSRFSSHSGTTSCPLKPGGKVQNTGVTKHRSILQNQTPERPETTVGAEREVRVGRHVPQRDVSNHLFSVQLIWEQWDSTVAAAGDDLLCFGSPSF